MKSFLCENEKGEKYIARANKAGSVPNIVLELPKDLFEERAEDLDVITEEIEEFGEVRTVKRVELNEQRKAQRIARETQEREAREAARREKRYQKIRSSDVITRKKIAGTTTSQIKEEFNVIIEALAEILDVKTEEQMERVIPPAFAEHSGLIDSYRVYEADLQSRDKILAVVKSGSSVRLSEVPSVGRVAGYLMQAPVGFQSGDDKFFSFVDNRVAIDYQGKIDEFLNGPSSAGFVGRIKKAYLGG